ncbi:MAG: hypothetical protein H6625_00295 [Bdellovibrionaceae bacterium]|nr:hypothetical protein [Pseudobdellovibrionaceae bacterium]
MKKIFLVFIVTSSIQAYAIIPELVISTCEKTFFSPYDMSACIKISLGSEGFAVPSKKIAYCGEHFKLPSNALWCISAFSKTGISTTEMSRCGAENFFNSVNSVSDCVNDKLKK